MHNIYLAYWIPILVVTKLLERSSQKGVVVSYLPRKNAVYISEEKRVKNWKVNIFTVKLLSTAACERTFSTT